MAKAVSNHSQAAQQVIKETKLSLHHSHFPASVFHLLAARSEKDKRDPLQEIIFDQYEEISRDFDESAVQSSASYRNCNKARRLAQLLIRVEGHLDLALLEQAAALLQQHLYSLGPKRHLGIIRDRVPQPVGLPVHQVKAVVETEDEVDEPFQIAIHRVQRDSVDVAWNTLPTVAGQKPVQIAGG